ncbi:hypothetical protein CD934_24920 [Streptomyces calvus]|uniref:Uncharacterized protein n=1 Tax=Streptomyces calvus TaxID=67282 RepID=A0A514JVY1_9ACTN|nr:hypothetical protein CD934_24920 [Streptomyces calvus]
MPLAAHRRQVSVLVDEPARRVTTSCRGRLHDRWGRLHRAPARRGHPVAARLLRGAHRRPALAAPRAGERHPSHLVSGGVDGGADPVVLMP